MLCFRKILLAKKFMEKKGERGESNFSHEIFLSQSTETFRRGNFSLSLVSVIENIYSSEGYVTVFCRNFCVSQRRNTS